MQILKAELKNVRFIREAVIPFDRLTCFIGNEGQSERHLLDALGFMSAVATRQEVEWLAREQLQWADFRNAQDPAINPEFVVEVLLAENLYGRWHCVYDLEKHDRVAETLEVSGNPAFISAEVMEVDEAETNEDFREVQQLLRVFAKPEEHSYDIFVDPIKRWPYLSRLTTTVDEMPKKAREKLLEAMRPLFPNIERLGVLYWRDGDKSFFYVQDGQRIGERAMGDANRKIMDIVMGKLSDDEVILLREVDDCQPTKRYSVIAEYLQHFGKQTIVTIGNPDFARFLIGAGIGVQEIRQDGGNLNVAPMEQTDAINRKESNLAAAD